MYVPSRHRLGSGLRAGYGLRSPWRRQLWHSLDVSWQDGGDSGVGLVTSVAWWEPVPARLSLPSTPDTHRRPHGHLHVRTDPSSAASTHTRELSWYTHGHL